MAFTVLGTSSYPAAGATRTNWDLVTPAQVQNGTTTLLCYAAESALSSFTPPTGWRNSGLGWGSGIGVAWGTSERDTSTYTSDGKVASDAASQAVTAVGTGSGRRSGAAVTLTDGIVRSRARTYGNVNASTTSVISGGNAWGSGVQGGNNSIASPDGTIRGCAVGDEVLIFLVSNRFDTPGVITASSMGLSGITKILDVAGTSSPDQYISVWRATVTTGELTVTPTFTIQNTYAGGAVTFAIQVYSIIPSVNTATLGAASAPIRIAVVGDSLTEGAVSAGTVLNGETPGESAERWIDRMFGVQSTITATTYNFQADDVVSKPAGAKNAWYTGSYTPFDGAPTTTVKVRNMGQFGWSTWDHQRAWRSQNIANPYDSGVSPDVLVINLGANDEAGANGGTVLNTADHFSSNLTALACQCIPAPYVVIVLQWAWAFDWYPGGTPAFNRRSARAAFVTALSEAVANMQALGKTVYVVTCGADAVTSGGTNLPTMNAANSSAGAVLGSGSGVDNIHATATCQLNTMTATVRTGLDQVSLLNPSAAPPSTQTPSLPTLPTLPSLP